jgi:hypothetical protein
MGDKYNRQREGNQTVRNLALLVLIMAGFFVKGQTSVRKEHYQFVNKNVESTLYYEKAMTHTDLDSLRFLNKRRLIPIEGTTVFIELYSAEELLEKYKQPISPLTIKDPSKARKVSLKLARNNYSMIVVPEKKK